MSAATTDSPLIVIVGPTASGKSTLGITIAKKFGGEIVACDSTQLYRGFDIGTAKPTLAERAEVPHHLLDVLEADEPSRGARAGIAFGARRASTQRGRGCCRNSFPIA